MAGVALSTFAVVFLAELPDKTAFATLVLATRYGVREVILGVWAAFLVQTAVACVAGGLLTLLPARPVRIAAGVGFLAFAAIAWFRNEEEVEAEEERAVAAGAGRQRPAWLSSFLVVFAAEWGDLTQLATAALVAQTHAPVAVGVGAVAALWSVTVIAALAGSALSRVINPRLLERVSAVVFALIGTVIIVAALRG